MASDQQTPRRGAWDPLWISGVFLGASIPALSFGNGALGGCFGLACLLALAARGQADVARRCWRLLKGPVGIFAGLTLVWWSVSATLSIDPAGSFEVIARLLVFLALGGWLIVALSARPDARRVAETVLLLGGAGVVGVAAVASYLMPDLLFLFEPLTEERIDPRHVFKAFAAGVAITLPVLLWIGWRRGGAWLGLAVFTLVPAALLLWGHGIQPARASIAGIFGGAILVALTLLSARLSPKGRVVLVGAVSLIGVAIVVWIVQSLPVMPFGAELEKSPPLPLVDFHRQAIWGFVLQKVGEAPLFGHGINTINLTDGANAIVPGLNQQFVPGHPHNWILEIASETGVPGFILFTATQALLITGFASAAVGGAPETRAKGLVGVAVLGIFWVASLANFSIWSAWWQVALLAALTPPTAALLDRAAPD